MKTFSGKRVPFENAAAFEGRVYTNKPTLLSPAAPPGEYGSLADRSGSDSGSARSGNGSAARYAAAFMRPLGLICAGLVRLHHREIDAVATALLRDRKLDGKKIHRILGRRTMPVRSAIFIVLAALEDGPPDTAATSALPRRTDVASVAGHVG
jgi:hypothetical protein